MDVVTSQASGLPIYPPIQHNTLPTLTMMASTPPLRRMAAAFASLCTCLVLGLAADEDNDDPCLLYLAQSTIPNGRFTDSSFILVSIVHVASFSDYFPSLAHTFYYTKPGSECSLANSSVLAN